VIYLGGEEGVEVRGHPRRLTEHCRGVETPREAQFVPQGVLNIQFLTFFFKFFKSSASLLKTLKKLALF